MAINNFAELIATAQAVGPKRIAVAAAADASVLASAEELYELGIATAHLIGDQAAIENIARREGLSLEGMTITHEPDAKAAARQVMALVRAGEADVAVKGQIDQERQRQNQGYLRTASSTACIAFRNASASGSSPGPFWGMVIPARCMRSSHSFTSAAGRVTRRGYVRLH